MAVDGVNLKGDTGSIYFRRHTEVVAVKTQSEPGILGRDELQTGSVPLDKLYRAYAVELALIAESVGCHSIFISKEAVVAHTHAIRPGSGEYVGTLLVARQQTCMVGHALRHAVGRDIKL